MRYTELEIRPSYSQVVYWSNRAVHDWYQSLGYTAEEIWNKGIYLGPRTVVLNTGKFQNEVWVEGMDIQFDVGKRKDEETEKGEIKVWNLSSEVLYFIQVGCVITLKSGYDNHYDTIFYGEISEISTKRVDGDEETTIKVYGSGMMSTDIKVWQVRFTSETFSYLFDQILKDTGFSAVYVGLGDVVYDDICAEGKGVMWDNGKTIVYESGVIPKGPSCVATMQSLKELLDEAMIQTNNYFYWVAINNRIYFIRKGYAVPAFVRLTPLTGLLEYKPTPASVDNSEQFDESEVKTPNQGVLDLYEVKSILIFEISPHSLIVIQPSLTGDSFMFRVRECDYKSSDDEHVVEFIAEKLYVYNRDPVYVNPFTGQSGSLIGEVGPAGEVIG